MFLKWISTNIMTTTEKYYSFWSKQIKTLVSINDVCSVILHVWIFKS